jgi:hypothetical protein
MNPRTTVSIIAALFILGTTQLVGALGGAPWAISCGVAIGLAGGFLLDFFNATTLPWWGVPLLALTASSVGILVSAAGGVNPSPAAMWVATPAAGLVSLAIQSIRRKVSQQCGLCKQRLGGLAFRCPRCGLLVCERKCWSFEAVRCRLCTQNKVPIFSADERWWTQQFGARVRAGKCQLCLGAASQQDLRPCKKCGRAQCRDCWDSANGQCVHCQWVVEDLPAALHDYMYPERNPEAGTVRRN